MKVVVTYHNKCSNYNHHQTESSCCNFKNRNKILCPQIVVRSNVQYTFLWLETAKNLLSLYMKPHVSSYFLGFREWSNKISLIILPVYLKMDITFLTLCTKVKRLILVNVAVNYLFIFIILNLAILTFITSYIYLFSDACHIFLYQKRL
jgi:hypothetical protein